MYGRRLDLRRRRSGASRYHPADALRLREPRIHSRARRYSKDDVERLRRRGEERRDPEKATTRALQWGLPVLESSITLIADGRLYYRGHDAAALARSRSIEEVTSLLWTGSFDGADVSGVQLHAVAGSGSDGLPFIARAQSVLPMVGANDPTAFNLRPHAVAQTGWRIVNLLASIAAESSELESTIDATLVAHWKPRGRRAGEVIRAALIACADHELNASAFTARCIASAGSNPYAVVTGALCALEGVRHGGATARVEAFLAELRRAKDVRRAIAERVRRGESLEGFGHPLYRDGDPRATLLLDMLGQHYAASRELAAVREAATAVADVVGERPTVDFALVAVERTLQLPRGGALTLFALGRSIGWIAHALEQYATDAPIRPRAKYVGPLPA
jgi:citrate synthase